jgi:hypothetical protein
MFFAIVTLFVALSISAVAAYYSIVGLMAIFAASAIPIAIMGTVLEVGKVWTAAWLYEYWNRTSILLKSYLTIAVIVLMFITSMGIFGFLSKAHIQQTSEALQNQSLIVRIEERIVEQNLLIDELVNSGVDAEAQKSVQIEENNRKKVQIISQYDSLVEEQDLIISEARNNLVLLDTYIKDDDIRKMQALVGAKVDGQYGSGTARKVEAFRQREEEKSSSIVIQARETISNLRKRQLDEISSIEELNERLRESIGTYVVDRTRIDEIRKEISNLESEKFELETQYRLLEAEVGPVKYIAEFVYGEESTQDLLEDAVRWVILIIIVVFDPLAVLLVIAGSMSLKEYFSKTPKSKYREESMTAVMVEDEMFLDDDEVQDIIKKKRRKPRGEDASRIR